MLLQFNFKNYKSFRDDTTLDFSATRISDYSNHVVELANERVLPIATIFGANASGKSNVITAFRYMQIYVLDSLNYGGDVDSKTGRKAVFEPTPFLFDNRSRKADSSFEVYFIDSDDPKQKTYNYGFSVNANGVTEEWLNYKSKSTRSNELRRVFYRKGNELDLSGINAKSKDNIKVALEKETLIVSLGAKLKISKLKLIRDWFLNANVVDFGEPEENYYLSRFIPTGFIEDKNVRKKVVDYFSAFDPSIVDFKVEVIPSEDGKKESYKIDSLHKMADTDELAAIPLRLESAGTLKMFTLYPILIDVLTRGGVLFIDELNARLHPLLLREFVINFVDQSINTKHAQLVFTSHDPWQLNLYRRDEIWFTEKDSNGLSTLFSLSDFVDEDGDKIRKDENFEKNYLLGKYGAIPELKNLFPDLEKK